MQTSIKVRRVWNAMLVAVPIEELAVIALQAVPGVRSPEIEREDMDGVVVAFDWTGPGQPDVPVEFLHRFGLELAPDPDSPTAQEIRRRLDLSRRLLLRLHHHVSDIPASAWALG